MGKWHFRKIARGETVKEPTQGAFFRWESNDAHGKTVIREGIQNALDARLQNENAVKVRIGVVHRQNSIKEIFSSNWWEHINARQNGIDKESIPKNEGAGAHRFLVFEDFNTIGLTGDETRHVAREEDSNNFYNFFRSVGGTDKEGGALGKWGIGKHTFWLTSRVNTVLGFTVQEGDSEMLCLGKTILKSHAIGNSRDKEYQDGFYGDSDGDFTLPLKGKESLDLAAVFGLKRKTETGLSLVVPWMDDEIKQADIKKCIVDDYFYPILAGQLEVSLGTADNDLLDEGDLHLNTDNIENYADAETKNFISLGRALKEHIANDKMVRLEPFNLEKPRWDEVPFSEEKINALRDDYFAGKAVFVRVSVNVVSHDGYAESSHFDIAIKHMTDEKKRNPLFIRGGIVITGETGSLAPTLALVVAEKSELANFLGKSENPSHTVWEEKSLKKLYQNTRILLGFVRSSVRNIVDTISKKDPRRDEYVLADIFPMERAGGESQEESQTQNDKEINPPSQPQMCVIQKVSGGFKVQHGKKAPLLGSQLKVYVAYNIRRGSPLSKYHENDFLLSSLEFDIEDEGLSEQEKQFNCFSAIIDSDVFSLHVTGFDPNRDLYVKATIIQPTEESS